MRLSPVLLAAFTVSATLGFSSQAKGETIPGPLGINSSSTEFVPTAPPKTSLAKVLAAARPVDALSVAQSLEDIPRKPQGKTLVLAKFSQPSLLAQTQMRELTDAGSEGEPPTPEMAAAPQVNHSSNHDDEPSLLVQTEDGETADTDSGGGSPASETGQEASEAAPESDQPEEESPEETYEEAQPPQEARVLVAEVDVQPASGDLPPELENEVYQVIATRPGRTTTRSQLQEDINNIFATGFFANVQAIPEDTPLGVRITFLVQPNPVLTNVRVSGNEVLPQAVVEEIFQEEYGEIINLVRFQDRILELNQWYQDNGYVLAQ
ncbi:MAG: hypothetical protein MJA27_05230, partial [Pseudanabaenales cyanobacterium]|nr:hypothetical protein [Pseudanabaenales cyanobacterium]